MKYIAIDSELRVYDDNKKKLQRVGYRMYGGAVGEYYKLKEDSDITYLVYKDGNFVVEIKSFPKDSIVLVTYNNKIIEVTGETAFMKHVIDVVDSRVADTEEQNEKVYSYDSYVGDVCQG